MRIIRPPPLKFTRKIITTYYMKKLVKNMAHVNNGAGFVVF